MAVQLVLHLTCSSLLMVTYAILDCVLCNLSSTFGVTGYTGV